MSVVPAIAIAGSFYLFILIGEVVDTAREWRVERASCKSLPVSFGDGNHSNTNSERNRNGCELPNLINANEQRVVGEVLS